MRELPASVVDALARKTRAAAGAGGGRFRSLGLSAAWRTTDLRAALEHEARRARILFWRRSPSTPATTRA